MMRRLILSSSPVVVALVLFALLAGAAAPPQKAIDLRTTGIAQLENEQPAQAEETFRALIAAAPEEPLGYANLAVALLRQQKNDEALAEIDKALGKAPGRADLLAIKAEILNWAGRQEEALAVYDQAVKAAPESLEILYGAYALAKTLEGEAAAQALAGRALERLATLRPENVVVLLQLGARAIAAGDRTAATGAYLRLKELLWQAPQAETAVKGVLDALEQDVASARVPGIRLENVLKVSPMFQQSLRELTLGIQGVPVTRFVNEPPPSSWGEPVPVEWKGRALADSPTAGRALAVGDFDGDGKPDVARLVAAEPPALEVRLAAKDWAPGAALPAPAGMVGLLAVDLDNDVVLDLVAYGPSGAALFRGKGDGSFAAADAFGLGGATAAAALDHDVEGDLDLALAGGASGAGEIYRNALDGPLVASGGKVLPKLDLADVRQALATDLDRDGDLDLLLVHAGGLALLDNLRQGRFADRTAECGLAGAAKGARAAVSADLDNDGLPDVAVVGEGLALFKNQGSGKLAPWPASSLPAAVPAGSRFDAVTALDADNDGRLDLALAGEAGVLVLAQRDGKLEPLPLAGGPAKAAALAAADLDRDGDLDLVAAGPAGLSRLDNEGGNKNHWLAVRLKGLTKGNSKNNAFGVGSTLEVAAGTAYQFREAEGDVVHFGLGKLRQVDLLRVVWTNGVPQNRLAAKVDQLVVEEQLLKGSCPFLYAWNGERIEFVTDLLWAAPVGLPVAPGVWAGADPSELVRVDGAAAADAVYRLKVTEELWEAAFFDHVRLWVVDHPEAVEVASNLRVVPGEALPERVLGSRGVEPVAAAWDGQGHEVTDRVRSRDEVYADGYAESVYQGVAAEPWTFTVDLGRAPAAPVRLHLDGWIFPADASLNLAVAQRQDLPYLPPRLEVETAAGWRPLLPSMGFPAGKTKTMVVDTPPLPAGARRLRIVSSLWLSWDRVAWTTAPADEAPRVVARLDPAVADLRFRGFSRLVRRAPNGPHHFDYERAATTSPWLPFPGRYTRYGDVRPLLAEADDRSVILAPGDEIDLAFDARRLAPPPAGWRRTVFLESHGWDKDADRNTAEPAQVEPLPFRAMSGYPYGPGERFPDTPLHREYLERWLTREVRAEAPRAVAAAGR